MEWLSELSSSDKVYYLSIGMLANALFVAPILTFLLPAYYGRYTGSYLVSVPAWFSWVVQECPAFFIPFVLAFKSENEISLPNKVLIAMMCLHYFNRSFIYPMNIRSKNPVPISITFFAFVFCTYNGFLQGIELTQNAQFGIEKLSSPSFIIGLVTFFCGFFGNFHSDSILRNLRKPGETGYKIPMGGLFQYVSAANYFAESIEWVGFAIACWNLASVSFAIYTISNLLPRALSHHEWYHQKFDNYPKDRKAFIPFLL